MDNFKIKLFGQTLTVRTVAPTEKITDRMVQAWTGYHILREKEEYERYRWEKSTCIGEPVSEHNGRTYLEVMSKFWS